MDLSQFFNLKEIIAQIASFLVLVVILKFAFWSKILKFLDARKERIASEFKKIEEAKSAVDKLQADYQARMDEIEALAQKKILEAVAEGRKITDEVRKSAHLEAQGIIENARQNIKHELTKAKEELKDKVIDLTISVAEDIIREKLTESQDRKLVREFLDKVDEA